jgi:DNA-binding GntR family transcriptional regulator
MKRNSRDKDRLLNNSFSIPRSELLARQVVTAIVEGTALGRFQPGQRLIETEVAEQLGVSRLPLREALKILETQGIVERLPRRGTSLMKVNLDKLRKILEVRMQLEVLALRNVIEGGRTSELVHAFDQVLKEMRRQTDSKNRIGISITDMQFHRVLCVASDNEVLVKLWEGLSQQLVIFFSVQGRQIPDLRTHYAVHGALRDVIKAGDASRAEEALISHIMEGWNFDEAFLSGTQNGLHPVPQTPS